MLASTPLELLRYRSNLLGEDLRITNFGGGNTSAKFELADPLTGQPQRVMAVKGSGGDLRSIASSGFALLYLDKLEALIGRYRGEAFEDEMVALYPLCAFGENRVAASIDTPLHAFLPFPHVDHLHPDWAIALAASANGARRLREFNAQYGRRIAWLPWQRPGFELALMLRRVVERDTPGCDGVILGGHGLFTWGLTAHECYLSEHYDHRPDGAVHPRTRAAAQAATIRWCGRHAASQPIATSIVAEILPAPARCRVVEPARDRPRRRVGRRADVCERGLGRGAVRPGDELSRSFSPHADLADVRALGSGVRGCRPASRTDRRAPRLATARTTRRTTRRSRNRIRQRCAMRTLQSSSFPASACSVSARTSARRASRRNSSSMRST